MTALEVDTIGFRPSPLELIPVPARESDDQLYAQYGGSREKWRDGLYLGSVKSKEDCEVAARIVAAGKPAVAEVLRSTYGIFIDPREQSAIDEIDRIKGQPPGKPLSAFGFAQIMPDLVHPSADKTHPEAYTLLTDVDTYRVYFPGMFTKFTLADTDRTRFLVAPSLIKKEPNGDSTVNIVSGEGFPATEQFQRTVAEALANKYNAQSGRKQYDPESVLIGVTSFNKSSRGQRGKDAATAEVIDHVHAEQVCREESVLCMLSETAIVTEEHSVRRITQEERQHQGSLDIWRTTDKGMNKEREGGRPDSFVARYYGLPLAPESPTPATRNHPVIEVNPDVQRMLEADPEQIIATAQADQARKLRQVRALIARNYYAGLPVIRLETDK